MPNEKKYIDVDKALEICQREYDERIKMADWSGDTVAWNIGNAIKALPSADVAEVRRGHWIDDGTVQICSECGEEHEWGEYRATYCEDCGARMDGGNDNA